MNLALGSLYAWSVFVLPLEKEFGWTRTDTSWVYTIAVVCFAATFIVAGRLQDRKGPKICAYAGGILVSLGFFARQLHHLAGHAVHLLRRDRRRRQRLRLLDADTGRVEVVPRQTRPRGRLDGRRLRRRAGDLRHARQRAADSGARLADDVPDPERHLPRDDDDRRDAAEESAGWDTPPNWTPKPAPTRRMRISRRARCSRRRRFYLLWIAFAFGTTAGQMTISQLVPFARTAGLGATVATYSLIVTSLGNAGGRILSGWMSDTIGRLRTLQMMVLLVGAGDAGTVSAAQRGGAVLRADRSGLLVLRHAAVAVRVDDRGFLRDAEILA